MRYGVDTSFLVAAELIEHPEHQAARLWLSGTVRAGDRLALAPQVLAEFIHVSTDPRRFLRPLDVGQARNLAEQWWTAREVDAVFPGPDATSQFLAWIASHQLGRKRLLDTMLAATYLHAGVTSLLTLNEHDFGIFGCFNCVRWTAVP